MSITGQQRSSESGVAFRSAEVRIQLAQITWGVMTYRNCRLYCTHVEGMCYNNLGCKR